MLLTTEKEAMERFLLEIRARILANLPGLYGRKLSDGEVIGIRHASFNVSEMHNASMLKVECPTVMTVAH
jgi:hypothetical protein